MYLRGLELIGFKSFAKKTIFSFTSPITAIVGPNGSGKSNVAEAFRWSLGEQSMKALRGKKGEDLIWNGSPGAPRTNRASVVLTFENEGKQFPIDFDTVTIAREVYRDGTNDYSINGSKVRLRDVAELLSGVSIGGSGHHIISQGEADRILRANPSERRAMVHDALGLKIYHWKLSESEKKLAKTKENLEKAESLRKEVSGHLRFLKGEVEKMEHSRQIREELGVLYREYLALEASYLEHMSEELQGREEEPTRELRVLEEEIKSAEKAAGGLTENKAEGGVREIEGSIEILRREKDELGRKLGKLEGMLEFSKKGTANPHASERADQGLVRALDVRVFASEITSILGEIEDTESIEGAHKLVSRAKSAISRFLNKMTAPAGGEDEGTEDTGMLGELEEERAHLEEELKRIIEREEELLAHRERIREGERESLSRVREMDRRLYEGRERRIALHGALEAIKFEREKLAIEEADFEREKAEARSFVGSSSLEEGKPQGTTHVFEERIKQTERRKKIERLKVKLEDAGPFNEALAKEYQEVSERSAYLLKEMSDLTESTVSLKKLIEDLHIELDKKFTDGIAKVNEEFKNFFSPLFGGGDASLRVIGRKSSQARHEEEEGDEENEEEGIDIKVNIPRKKVHGLEMLSGGERALTSIALLFALTRVSPPPFLILDETDAALDEANSKKYADMLEDLSKVCQLILITHNRETMSRAGVLYGVTMGSDGVSRLLSVKFEEAVKIAK